MLILSLNNSISLLFADPLRIMYLMLMENNVDCINEKAAMHKSVMIKLNDDCLINIFGYLSIKDRLVAERGKNFPQIFINTRKLKLKLIFKLFLIVIDVYLFIY